MSTASSISTINQPTHQQTNSQSSSLSSSSSNNNIASAASSTSLASNNNNNLNNTNNNNNSNDNNKSKKYSAFNINNIYKGKSLENPKTSVIVPKHGLQTVGKVGAGRRVPPSANIGSLKTGTNTDTTSAVNNNEGDNLVNIVPAGGQGWPISKEEESSSSSSSSVKDSKENSLSPIETCQPQKSSAIVNNDQISSAAASITTTTDYLYNNNNNNHPPLNASYPQNQPTPASNIDVSDQHYRDQSYQQFSEEFPPISGGQEPGGNGGGPPDPPNKLAKDVSLNLSRKESIGLDQQQQKPPPLLPLPQSKDHHHHQQQQQKITAQCGYPHLGNYGHIDGGCEKEKSTNDVFTNNNENSNNNNNNNVRNKIGYAQSQHHSSSSSSSSNSLTSYSSSSQQQTATGSGTATKPSQQQPINTTELFSLPTSSDHLYSSTNSNRLNNDRNRQQQPYPSNSSNQIQTRRNKPEPKPKFVMEKPAIIDDQELKNLDKILKTDMECDWALEQEIDYSAKIEFSDNDSDEEPDKAKEQPKNQTADRSKSGSRSTESNNLLKYPESQESSHSHQQHRYNLLTRDSNSTNASRSAEHQSDSGYYGGGSHAPPPQKSMAPPPNVMDQQMNNRYYGRKSDPSYESMMRKDNEHYEKGGYGRRGGAGEYHSSRSQQLPRGGGSSGGYNATTAQAYSKGPSSNFNVQPPPPPPPPIQIQSRAGPAMEPVKKSEEELDYWPKRIKKDANSGGPRDKSEDDDSVMAPPPQILQSNSRDKRDYRSGGNNVSAGGGGGPSMYSKPATYPPPNLPPRLLKQAEMMNNAKNTNCYDNRDTQRGRRSPLQSMDRESRDYISNERHNRRTPPEYDNMGRRYKSTISGNGGHSNEPSNWRKQVMPPPPTAGAQHLNDRRNSAADTSENVPKKLLVHGAESDGNNQTKRETNDTSNKTLVAAAAGEDSKKPEPEQCSSKDVTVVAKSSPPSQPIRQNNDIKSTEISSESKITILEKPVEKTKSPSPKPTSVLTGSSAEVKNSSDDLNRSHHHHHQPSHQHHHQQQQQQPIIRNSRSFNNTSHTGSSHHMKQNVDTRKINVATGGGGGRYNNETVDRNRGTPPATHQQPQRKYSNNSSERFTPPSVSLSSNSSAKPNDTVSYNRRDYSQPGGGSGGYSSRNISTSHNQNQHPATKFNDSSVGKHDSGSGKQMSTSIGHGEGGNRSRQESFQSSNSKAPSVAAVSVQQSSVVIIPQETALTMIAASTSVAPTTTVYAPSSAATEKRAPPAPVRASTTYGPPPTNIAKVFGDVPSASSSPPIIHHQQPGNEVKQQSSNTNAPLKSTPPPAQISPSSTSSNSNQQAPRHQQYATGKHQPSSESRSSNRLMSGGRYRTGRDSIKPQRSTGGGVSTKQNIVTVVNPKSVSSQSTGPGSINAPVQPKSQDPQEDLNNDEWETASESSDLMERSTNLLSNNNRKSNENEKAVTSSSTVSSGQSPPQTSSISVTQPPKHSSDRTIYSSKTTISNASGSHAKAPPSAHPPAPSSSSSSVNPRHEQNRRDATRYNDSYGHHYSGPRSHYGSSSNSMMHHGSSYRGSSSRGLGPNTGKSSYRNGPAPPSLSMNSKRQHSQTSGERGSYSYHQQERRQPQESISNQMSKMSLDHHSNDSYGGKMPDDDTRRHRKNSANQSREDYAMDHHNYDDDCGKKANNQQRANPKLAKQRKERSKSKNQGNRSNSNSEQSQSPGASIASKESQSGSNMEPQSINKDQRADASKDPKGSNTSNPQQKQPMKSTSVVSTVQQQESNVESLGGDQPRPASTSTSQRSSPKVEETKCATGGGNKNAQQPQTMVSNDSQSLTPCSSNSLKKTESPLNISKIPDMDTSTNIISNRKIVGTLIYENTKLKEENKVLSKIEEVVPATSAQNNSTITVVSNINTNTTSQSINSKGFSSSLTTSSSSSTINEELNMRIASVKKVWDSAPNNDHQSSSNVVSTGDSTVDPRKNSMLASNSNAGLMSSGSPIEKTFDQKSKSSSSSNNNMPVNLINNNNNVQNRKQSNFNLMLNNGSNQMVSMNNATSPPVVDLNRSYVSNNSTGTFHQNAAVIQTPTSPPTLSQMYGPQNLAANLAYVHQMAATADQLNFGAAPGQPNQLAQVYPAPHAFMQQGTLAAAAAAAHQQNPFNAMATALMTNNPQGTPHNPANMFMAQLTQTQPGALVHDHQYNKFALAPNNLIKPFVHPNQTSGGQMNNLQSTSWPGVQQQVSAGPNQFYAAANPMASHFVQNPLNPNAVTVPGSAMIPSTTSSGSQVGNQVVSAANAFNNRQPNSLSRNNSMVMDNGQSSSNAMRSFMGPGGNQNAVTGATMSMNDIHHSHHHANQMAAAHHQMSNNASHFMNDQSVGVGRGPAQQQLNMHHAHRNQFANTNQQNLNVAAAVAASNWTNNPQMFFNQKLPNGRQLPMHLISQPMYSNANNAAALAAAAQLNPRTSPLNVQAATALLNNSNYPNPIQRPSGSNSGQAQSKGGNRNNGSNKASFSSNNNNMGKSRQYQNNNSNNNSNNNINNNNRSSSTPSPGTNVGAASVANSMSANTVSSTATAGVNMITDQSTTVSNKD